VVSHRVGILTGLLLLFGASGAAAAVPRTPAVTGSVPVTASSGHAATIETRPWVEGVDPTMENRVFFATYGALRSHNVLKIYAFSAGGYESAGIRFSGRIPHDQRDLSVAELTREAVTLVRTTFDEFPDVQELDVWATIPVAQADQTSVESTVFSVSADRATYERISRNSDLTDADFLDAFGRVWVAPQVPR
jgi:hypothetical protein